MTSVPDDFVVDMQKPSSSEEELINDIHNLTKSIQDIEEGFERVTTALVAFDNARYLDKDNHVLQLAPQWHEYFTRFKHTVEESRLHAAAVSACMQQYSNVILVEFDQSSDGEFQSSRERFTEKLNRKVADALQIKDGFATLSVDLLALETVVKDAIREAGVYAKDQQPPTIEWEELAGLTVASRIDTITNFWRLFEADITTLQAHLAQNADPDAAIPSEFAVRSVAAARKFAMKLATVLDTYVVGTAGEV